MANGKSKPAYLTAEAVKFLSNPKGLTQLANQIKKIGQMGGATVEIAHAILPDSRQIFVAGLNSSADWDLRQLTELARLGIEVAPQTMTNMGKQKPHAEENIAAHISQLGGRGLKWSHAVVGAGKKPSYVCRRCQSIISLIGGVIEDIR